MGQEYSIHIVNLNGFDIKYTISNDNRQILLPLKINDILNNSNFSDKYIINLEWLKKRANDDKDYVVVKTVFTCGESIVYAVIPYFVYSADRLAKFKN